MKSFDEFLEVVKEVRAHCPWDSVQTHESLKPYLEEEAGEVSAGIDRLLLEEDSDNLCEELGDVLFLVALHSVIAEEEGLFTIEDVAERAAAKMRWRHPKIFSPDQKELTELSWEELKKRERDQIRAACKASAAANASAEE